MTFDIIEERGGSIIDIRWGDSKDCHFPLFPALKPLQYPYMTFIYGVMWLGGYKHSKLNFLYTLSFDKKGV